MEPNLASDVAQKVAWTSAPLMTNSQLLDAKSFILWGALLQTASVIRGEAGRRRKEKYLRRNLNSSLRRERKNDRERKLTGWKIVFFAETVIKYSLH